MSAENPTDQPPLCKKCGKYPRVKRWEIRNGKRRNGFRAYCRRCVHGGREWISKYPRRLRSREAQFLARVAPKTKCRRCGFVPEHTCQMDYHHLDGNHKNDELSNVAVLCANCHRLFHQQSGDEKILLKLAPVEVL